MARHTQGTIFNEEKREDVKIYVLTRVIFARTIGIGEASMKSFLNNDEEGRGGEGVTPPP